MSNRLYFISLAAFLVFLLSGCQKEEKKGRDYPQIRTLPVDHITSQGARFNAAILSGSPESITEYGFIWGKGENLTLSNSEKVMMEESPEKEGYSNDITFALEEMKEYYVRCYIKAGSLVIYGDVVKFMSLGSMAPEITDFEPKAANWGDTIAIYGKNFSFVSLSNTVHFGNLVAKVVSCTNEILKVVVPDVSTLSMAISVEVLGNIVTASKLFELVTPGKITSVDKKNITWGDTIWLTGTFPFSTHEIKIYMDNIPVVILERNEAKIQIIVPINLKYYDSLTVDLSIDKHLVQAIQKNHMIFPLISSVGNGDFGWNDTINISGLFNPVKTANKVLFSGIESKILWVTRERIRCIVPDNGLDQSATLRIETNGVALIYPTALAFSGPVIEKIKPNRAAAGVWVEITGKYFKGPNTRVMIGNQVAYAYVDSRHISAQMPVLETRGYVPVNVKVYNKEKTYNNLLTYLKPIILDFNPKEGTFGDIITVTGEEFDPNDLSVSFENGGIQYDPLEKTATMVKFSIPNSGTHNPTSFYINTMSTIINSPVNLKIYPPRLDLVTPINGFTGDLIRITGAYFNPENIYNRVHIGNSIISCNSNSPNYIDFNLPEFVRGDYSIQVENGSDISTFMEAFHCISPWKIENPIVGNERIFSSSFLSNDNLWLIGGKWGWDISDDIYVYSLNSKSFTRFSSKIYTTSTFAFEINGQGYFGLGMLFDGNDRYFNGVRKINLSNHSITSLLDFPGPTRKYSFSFSLLSKGYVGSGLNDNGLLNDFWKFDPETETWNQLPNLPFGSVAGATVITMNNKAYVVSANNLWEYDPTLNSWMQLADYPGVPRFHGTGFSIGNNLYYGAGTNNLELTGNDNFIRDLWKYSSLNDSWIRVRDLPFSGRIGAYGFSFNGKGYIGGGHTNSEADLLEYDPSYE